MEKRLLIYKSSAGSGKTFNLVKEYLKLALAPDESAAEYRAILAVTFTNKATEEIKERIIKTLYLLANAKDGDALLATYLKELNEAGAKITLDTLRKRAQAGLDQILHRYGQFSVSTIDSFFQRIVRSFARELKMPMRYNLDMDNGKALTESVDIMMQRVGEQGYEQLTNWLETFALNQIEEGKTWDLRKEIAKLGSQIFSEAFQEIEPFLFLNAEKSDPFDQLNKFIDELKYQIEQFELGMEMIGTNGLKIIDDNSLHIDHFAHGDKGAFNHFNKIRQHNYEPSARARTTVEAPDTVKSWYSKKGEHKKNVIEQVVNGGLLEHLAEAVALYDDKYEAYLTAKTTLKNIYTFGILTDLALSLEKYRRENETILTSDANRLINRVVSESDTPFIYEKVGARYKHYLIDEFQDTSTFQWQNFLPLVGSALSENNRAMLVGDVKQSIYRWRGGNPDLLLNQVTNDLKAFEDSLAEIALTTNYRSLPNIIRFNNAVFSTIITALEGNNDFVSLDKLRDAYRDAGQQIKSGEYKEQGYVKLTFIEDNPKEDGDEAKYNVQTLNKIYECVMEARVDGYELGDIAIISRNNASGSLAANFLFKEKGVKVVSQESLLLEQSSFVRLLTACLAYLDNPMDKLRKTEILYEYLVYLKPELLPAGLPYQNLFADAQGETDSLFEKLLPEKFTKETHYLSRLPLYDMAEELISRFGLNSQPDAYLQAFLDAVLDFSKNESPNLTGFLKWWDENKGNKSVNLPPARDAVKIVTIHKSKGLEYPVVIMPFLDFELKPSSAKGGFIWATTEEPPFNAFPFLPVSIKNDLNDTYFAASYQHEILATLMDNINVLYVGFTRAAERLYLSAKLPKSAKEDFVKTQMPVNQVNKANQLLLRLMTNDFTPENYDKPIARLADGWDPLNLTYTLGARHKPAEAGAKEETNWLQLTEFLSNHWRSKLTIRPKGGELFQETENGDSFNRHILARNVINSMKYADELDKTVEKLYYEGLFGREEGVEIKKAAQKLIALPQASDWFRRGANIHLNREILLPNGLVLKPERVIYQGETATVVNFKVAAAENEAHRTQMNHQIRALKQMGFNRVSAYIVYVAQELVVSLGD